jgi:hypothetical protein
MRLVRSFEEFNERDLTGDEIKEAIGHAQASMLEYARRGQADQAQAAFNARDDLLLALAERLKEDEVA